MRNLLVVMAVLLAGMTCLGAATGTAAQLKAKKTFISLADAKGRIDKAIASPAVMKAIMQHLSADDQKLFLTAVNAAIATMPGSDADRTATFVAANRAALEGAQRGNVATLVAESFATVAPMALPALAESLGSDLMNRATDKGGKTYSDADYLKLAQVVMERVNARVAEVDHSDVRSGFAALMFVRGSNSQSSGMVDGLIAMLPPSARETAKKEWFPEALAEGSARNYESMLAAADVETDASTGSSAASAEPAAERPASGEVLLRIAGPQIADSLLADIAGANTDATRAAGEAAPFFDTIGSPAEQALPAPVTGEAFGNPAAAVGESVGYHGQTTR